jgi:hypothetical protein
MVYFDTVPSEWSKAHDAFIASRPKLRLAAAAACRTKTVYGIERNVIR